MFYCVYKKYRIVLYLYEEDGEITDISFCDLHKGTCQETELLVRLKAQLEEYFYKGRKELSGIPFRIAGTETQKRIYREAAKIPYGETVSYAELAERAGNRLMARSVGSAMAKNRLPFLIPCHRVIRGDGTPGRYGGGDDLKRYLLDMEKNGGIRREKSCGAVVYRTVGETKEFLVEFMGMGHISLPKGHMEAGETEEETALREIGEETGIEVALDTGFRKVSTYQPEPYAVKDVVFFVAEYSGGTVVCQETEVRRAEFLPLDEALSLLTYDSDRRILKQAGEYLSGK